MEEDLTKDTELKGTIPIDDVKDVMMCSHLKDVTQAFHVLIARQGKTNEIECIVFSCEKCATLTENTFAGNAPIDSILEKYRGDEFFIG